MTWPIIFGNLPAGNQPLSLFDTMFNLIANLVAIPCTAGGSANAITLTGSLPNSPPVTAYQNFQPFKFKAVANSTNLVTLQFGALPLLPVYRRDGVTQCGQNDIVNGFDYSVIFDQSRNGNTGGFYLEDSGLGMQGSVAGFSQLASAATVDLGSVFSTHVQITGTTTITSFGTTPGLFKTLRFSGAMILTHSASLFLPNNGNNITTANGDAATFVSDASGNWKCLSYQLANGQALVSGGGGGFAGITPSVQLLTASQTVTIPTGATKCKVTLVAGAGGGGGGAFSVGCPTSFPGAGGPGGPGGTLIKYLSTLTAGNTLILTIGAAGPGGSSAPSAGSNGGDTTLASGTQTITTLTAGHGVGGGAGSGAAGAAGTGGTATNGDFNMPGALGTSSIASGALSICAPPALFGSAPSNFSSGAGVVGPVGQGFGSPGAGGCAGNSGSAAGGSGTAGCAMFEWYP